LPLGLLISSLGTPLEPGMEQLLMGRRVLVAEDEYLLAMVLQEGLEAHGATVQGPFSNVKDALASLVQTLPDIAVLDVNLRDELIYPVADRLLEAQVPMVLTTGYDRGLIPAPYSALPFCGKPLTLPHLVDVLRAALGAPATTSAASKPAA
jgi:CheY-like chemotaxis protein